MSRLDFGMKTTFSSVIISQFGLRFLDFQKFGVAFESSGAFGKTALKVWDRLKYMASEVGLDNYVIAGDNYVIAELSLILDSW